MNSVTWLWFFGGLILASTAVFCPLDFGSFSQTVSYWFRCISVVLRLWREENFVRRRLFPFFVFFSTPSILFLSNVAIVHNKPKDIS